MTPKAYISGPITGNNDYLEDFQKAETELREMNLSPINPAKVNNQLPTDSMTYGEYMEMSLTMLNFCEFIYVLDGWEESRGARFEIEYARMHKKEILYQTRHE